MVSDRLKEILDIAQAAGAAVMEVYQGEEDWEIQQKDDDSPVTKADHAAHQVIMAGLSRITPDTPVISEEGGIVEYSERRGWTEYWLVDPLDGTKEFINRNGEFTINIALIRNYEPVLGVVFAPALSVSYLAERGEGAWKIDAQGQQTALRVRPLSTRKVDIVASRRHGGEQLDKLLSRLQGSIEEVHYVNMGSSLKLCVLAEGQADWYPRLAPTSEWDTAAAHAVLQEAGGKVVDDGFRPLRYNCKESLLNPHFHCFADADYPWQDLLENI
ncbi:MAG: 3'(2'),5'-bisphosphate nucleotidase CysQ [Pseudomonadales bacterium]|uniref:3'(2'),5'-bisphosphate nucleotidase CysQ n=1 Tax=Oleiphilus messinensis TaxID=141451 RepID=A0A1Y0I4U9_9GAMM|nr:3'(2'),5'-bisphosphate nucleotidase CysQ [Oleiphilus messinensis]ARU54443.1 thioredoxin [Oleiphilus messinensis]MCG8613891.1 3'(2'),5'-bisphosphate nucleotidase CysQ [Pseudomonadales bacterium]